VVALTTTYRRHPSNLPLSSQQPAAVIRAICRRHPGAGRDPAVKSRALA
jgi:hypothetical protein